MNQNTINHNYLRSDSARDSEISEYWYEKSKKEKDIDKKEEYANRAVFKSPQVAHREFLKANLKEKTRVADFHSNTVLAVLDKSSMGISSTQTMDYNGRDEQSSCGSEKTTYGTANPNLIPQYLLDTDHTIHHAIFSTMVKISTTNAERLVTAYLLMRSGYDKVLSLAEYNIFENEFEYLHAIMNKHGKLNMINLWTYSIKFKHILGYSVSKYALFISYDSIIEKFKNYYGTK